MSTNVLSSKQIDRRWHLVDAQDQVLGRIATEIATKLMGKNKASFVPYLDNGDFVVVTNATKVKVSGKKMNQKLYHRHSGYPGGMRVDTLSQMMDKKPTEVIKHAVRGMLPKNKLGDKMIKKLHVFSGSEHNFRKQLGLELKTEKVVEEKQPEAEAIDTVEGEVKE